MIVDIDGKTVELSDEQVEAFHALTKLQKGVVLGILSGLSQREAYRRAGDGKAITDNAVDQIVSKMLTNAKVSRFMKSFKLHETQKLGAVVMSRDEMAIMLHEMATVEITPTMLSDPTKLKHISEVIVDPDGATRYKLTSPADRRAAAKQLAELLGYNKPQQVELSGVVATAVTPQQVLDFKKAFNETF